MTPEAELQHLIDTQQDGGMSLRAYYSYRDNTPSGHMQLDCYDPAEFQAERDLWAAEQERRFRAMEQFMGRLTDEDLQILGWLVDGWNQTMIADAMGVTQPSISQRVNQSIPQRCRYWLDMPDVEWQDIPADAAERAILEQLWEHHMLNRAIKSLGVGQGYARNRMMVLVKRLRAQGMDGQADAIMYRLQRGKYADLHARLKYRGVPRSRIRLWPLPQG